MIKAKLIIERDNIDYDPIMGGFQNQERWRAFLKNFKPEFRPYAIAIKNALIEAGLVPSYGSQYSNDYLFKFSDGRKPVGLSFRSWGDFISAIVGKKEGYMAYY